ncbi:MAG TPA: endonuclease domain-containing protein [Anaerolineales bacterium]|nr:endonuclease domain-containing protein [Anaerolineales bacterium]
MPANNIVTRQKVSRVLEERAKTLRKTMTAEEHVLWEHLRANRLHGHPFRRQQIIGRFIADFYCHTTNLVVELDGPIHEDRREYDQERDAIIAAHGLTILRFRNEQVQHDLNAVLDAIALACHRAADASPAGSPPRDGEGPGGGSNTR